MHRADRWIKKFRPEGPFVSARDGLPLNGKVYAIGEPVDVTGLGPRRLRVLYDAGRLGYPPQDSPLFETGAGEPVAGEVPEIEEIGEDVDGGDDELAEEFEEMLAEDATAEEKPKPRPKKKTAPIRKKK